MEEGGVTIFLFSLNVFVP